MWHVSCFGVSVKASGTCRGKGMGKNSLQILYNRTTWLLPADEDGPFVAFDLPVTHACFQVPVNLLVVPEQPGVVSEWALTSRQTPTHSSSRTRTAHQMSLSGRSAVYQVRAQWHRPLKSICSFEFIHWACWTRKRAAV